MLFIIEIQYRKGPSFETRIHDDSEKSAKSAALTQAEKNGFGSDIKKIIVMVCHIPKKPEVEAE